MSNESRKLVVLVTHGSDDEQSTVAFTVANGAIKKGLDVSVFLTSAGVDLARKRATDMTRVAPFEPLTELIGDFVDRGGQLWACTPCVRGRGYEEADLIEGTVVTGASPMIELIAAGAATLSF